MISYEDLDKYILKSGYFKRYDRRFDKQGWVHKSYSDDCDEVPYIENAGFLGKPAHVLYPKNRGDGFKFTELSKLSNLPWFLCKQKKIKV